MSSVLINGMNMPTACEWCSFMSTFITEIGLGCRCEVGKFEFWDYTKRQENCPLVAVPTPHGRLIDADELEKCVHEWYDVGEYVSADTIRNADTIIEAEASE